MIFGAALTFSKKRSNFFLGLLIFSKISVNEPSLVVTNQDLAMKEAVKVGFKTAKASFMHVKYKSNASKKGYLTFIYVFC